MENKERIPQFLHYQQEISTPSEDEYKKGYFLPFDFGQEVESKFSDPNKPRELARLVRELIINCHEHGNRFNPDKKVFVTVSETSDCLVVTVQDEGAGYPDELIEDLKIPFYQKPTQKRGSRGSGFYGVRKGLEDNRIDDVEIVGNKIKLTIKK